jgi:predicted ArsR family transcriptional regulator
MNTTDRIKKFLDSNQAATVEQISQALGLTKADIHYHIRQLLIRDEISVSRELYQSGPGRPARQYQLVKSIPSSLTRIIIPLLVVDILGTKPGKSQINTISEKLAKGILEKCPSTFNEALSPTIKLNRIISELASHGFILRWQAAKTGPVILIDEEPLSFLFENPVLVKKTLESLVRQIKKNIA